MTRRQSGLLRAVKRIVLRTLFGIAGLWLAGIILFSLVPVPFSAVMVERQVSAWLEGNFSYRAHSDWVGAEAISPWMGLAVIAAEDQKFPDHWGIDFTAVEQALAHNERGEGQVRGASTLSQQTVKNLFLWDGRSWIRKGLEAGLTFITEAIWSKRRILTVYLNIAEFGEGIFGVEAASRHYFKKPASQLTPAEAARLAAVLPNPIRFKVNAPSGYVIQRQQWILRQMRQLGGQAYMQQHGL